MNFPSGKHQKGIKPLLTHGDVFHLEDPQFVLTPGNSVLPDTETHSDTSMELQTSWGFFMETGAQVQLDMEVPLLSDFFSFFFFFYLNEDQHSG